MKKNVEKLVHAPPISQYWETTNFKVMFCEMGAWLTDFSPKQYFVLFK